MSRLEKYRELPYVRGLAGGLPIGLGYLSVSFAFGIFTVERGFAAWQALLISALDLTSAGQLAGVSLMSAGAPFTELALSQLVINLRYSVMSLSLSQKLDKSMRTGERLLFSFIMTDEVFAVASSEKSVGRTYMAGLGTLPVICWSLGTFAGGLFGEVLPSSLVSCLGIAIYGMFIAIIVPPAKKSKPVLFVILLSAAISCLIRLTPLSSFITEGFSIIIAALASSLTLAALCPLPEEKNA